MLKIFSLLFKPTDLICAGSAKDTKVYNVSDVKDAEFFSINPLKESRKDLNVTEFRNFLFEMDNMPLDQQRTIIQNSNVPLTSVIYSGSKSYHVIISLETALDLPPHQSSSVQSYKKTWGAIAQYLAKKWQINVKEFDTSCQNPSRFSRFPGHLRSNGNVQEQVLIGKLWTSEDLQNALKGSEISSKSSYNNSKPSEFLSLSEVELESKMPPELKARLKYPRTWAKGTAGNYPELLKIILWMIDSTSADHQTIQSYLSKKVFPILIQMGYPEHKLDKPINDAFKMKGF